MLHIMTRQVFHATLTFNHATSGKKMSKGDFILLSGANLGWMGSTGAAATFGQKVAPENEMVAVNPYNTCISIIFDIW